MSEMGEKERAAAIKGAVERSFEALQSQEMQTPEEAGASAAQYAFAQALERERARSARRRERKG